MEEQIYTKPKISHDPVINYGKPIWERLFLVRVQQKYIQTDQETRMFGLPSVGDPYIDSQFHNQLVDVMITINDMVEYYRKGVTVRITVHEDTKTIYEIIKNYLISWNQKLLNGINIEVAPIDDLVLLDKFASAIYPHAKSHFKAEDALKQLMGSMGNSSSSWLGRNSFNQQELAPEQVPEKHESMAQILSEKIIGRNRPTEISGDRQPQIFKSKW